MRDTRNTICRPNSANLHMRHKLHGWYSTPMVYDRMNRGRDYQLQYLHSEVSERTVLWYSAREVLHQPRYGVHISAGTAAPDGAKWDSVCQSCTAHGTSCTRYEHTYIKTSLYTSMSMIWSHKLSIRMQKSTYMSVRHRCNNKVSYHIMRAAIL